MPAPLPTQTLRSAAVAAMVKNGFEPEFSPAVMREVRSLDDPSDEPLPSGVLDQRSLDWSSIDNRESRDLDQIEVAERLADGSIRIRIGVVGEYGREVAIEPLELLGDLLLGGGLLRPPN